MAPQIAVVHLAAESRDSHLTPRRVERQQQLVALLAATRQPVSSAALARRLGVGLRTVERDLATMARVVDPSPDEPGGSSETGSHETAA
jgi:predicted DNA-binding transcriptional regulator YafY